MFGCKSHLPIDLIFGTSTADLKSSSITYIENLKKRMAWAYQTTNDVIKKEQEREQTMLWPQGPMHEVNGR